MPPWPPGREAEPGRRLRRGDLLPKIRVPPPGPRSRELSRRLELCEAPGINTLAGPASEVPSLLWEEARGANVLDVDGNRFLDLTSGFGAAAIGHRHPRVITALRHQSSRLLHGLGDVHAHPARVRLAERLAALAPVDEPRVYFGISGAEAVEIALKTALLANGRPEILAFEPAYHGLTLGALAATSRPAFRLPFAPWLAPRVHRLPFGCPPARVAELLDERPQIGALLFEPVAGREGVLLPPGGWLAGIAGAARRCGVAVIADEIFTGFGRTGRWFGVDEAGVRPDLLVCGKALGGGLPLAAVVGRRELMAAWGQGGEALHTATFVAHPLACAAALAALEVLEGEDLPGRAARLGPRVGERLLPWRRRFPGLVAEVRGRGLLWGLELTSAALAGGVGGELLRRGVLALVGGPEGRVLQLVPPLTITGRQLTAALDILAAVLGRMSDAGTDHPAGDDDR